jgi:hypothetical protein
MNMRLLLLLALALMAFANAELTVDDILAKEVAWAKRAARHFHLGFLEERSLEEKSEELQMYFMPEHRPSRSAGSLRGARRS